MNHAPLVVYDGECALCHWAVRFIRRQDKKGKFHFTPQQGNFVRSVLSDETRKELPDSVWLIDSEGRLYLKGDAVLYVLRELKGIWLLPGWLFGLIPRVIRNYIYDFVASRRKRIGRDIACELPPGGERTRFLE